jgi:hypothetical protein
MRSWFETFRKNWKAWAYAVLGALALAAFVEFHTGFLEETGWSARQIGAKVGKWAAGASAPDKGKVETGSIPQAPAAKPDPQPDVQRKEAAARARKARCEKERHADMVEAEKELAVLDYRARLCVAEAKLSVFTAGNPERACKKEIDAKGASEVRRDATAGGRC